MNLNELSSNPIIVLLVTVLLVWLILSQSGIDIKDMFNGKIREHLTNNTGVMIICFGILVTGLHRAYRSKTEGFASEADLVNSFNDTIDKADGSKTFVRLVTNIGGVDYYLAVKDSVDEGDVSSRPCRNNKRYILVKKDVMDKRYEQYIGDLVNSIKSNIYDKNLERGCDSDGDVKKCLEHPTDIKGNLLYDYKPRYYHDLNMNKTSSDTFGDMYNISSREEPGADVNGSLMFKASITNFNNNHPEGLSSITADAMPKYNKMCTKSVRSPDTVSWDPSLNDGDLSYLSGMKIHQITLNSTEDVEPKVMKVTDDKNVIDTSSNLSISLRFDVPKRIKVDGAYRRATNSSPVAVNKLVLGYCGDMMSDEIDVCLQSTDSDTILKFVPHIVELPDTIYKA